MENQFEVICDALIEWVNHPKNGIGRRKEKLKKFQNVWNWIIGLMREFESMGDNVNEVQKEFLELAKYEGKLHRYHIKYKKDKENYGVRAVTNHVSWTKSESPLAFYWAYEGVEYLRLTTYTTENAYAIDLVGLSEFIDRNIYEGFKLGTPALLKEQEVIFPLDFSLIDSIDVIKG